jgi:hypothetical protein
MVKKCTSPYAARSSTNEHDERSDDEDDGPHITAHKKLKQDIDQVAKRIKTKNKKHNCTEPGRANLIIRHLDTRMQFDEKNKKEIYYKDPAGIDMTYPIGSKVRKLKSLKIIEDNIDINKFNVIVGCEKKNKEDCTFVVLKVSERNKVITHENMERYNESLEGLLRNKPTVKRGPLRNGVTIQYVCYGIRKNPLDPGFGEYAYKSGVGETEKQFISAGINNLVRDIETRAMGEMNAANLSNCTGCVSFVKTKIKFGLPSIYEGGYATQLALARAYSSQMHTDRDFYHTFLSCYDKEAEKDEILYYFCFPTYGFAVPMKSGDIIMFNPLVPHCATNPRRETALIYSMYVSNKTCNTVVANNTKEGG